MSFENVTLTQSSKDYVKDLIRKQFDQTNYLVYNFQEFRKMYTTALDLGLEELAQEMNQDFYEEYNTNLQ